MTSSVIPSKVFTEVIAGFLNVSYRNNYIQEYVAKDIGKSTYMKTDN